jgi:hypothetical protein
MIASGLLNFCHYCAFTSFSPFLCNESVQIFTDSHSTVLFIIEGSAKLELNNIAWEIAGKLQRGSTEKMS